MNKGNVFFCLLEFSFCLCHEVFLCSFGVFSQTDNILWIGSNFASHSSFIHATIIFDEFINFQKRCGFLNISRRFFILLCNYFLSGPIGNGRGCGLEGKHFRKKSVVTFSNDCKHDFRIVEPSEMWENVTFDFLTVATTITAIDGWRRLSTIGDGGKYLCHVWRRTKALFENVWNDWNIFRGKV